MFLRIGILQVETAVGIHLRFYSPSFDKTIGNNLNRSAGQKYQIYQKSLNQQNYIYVCMYGKPLYM